MAYVHYKALCGRKASLLAPYPSKETIDKPQTRQTWPAPGTSVFGGGDGRVDQWLKATLPGLGDRVSKQNQNHNNKKIQTTKIVMTSALAWLSFVSVK